MVEGDHIRSVDERQPQVLGHEARSEVLTAAHKLLGGVPAGTGALGKRRELIADRIVEVQLVGDVEIALADVGKQVLAGNVVVHVSVYEIQQVGDLGVGLGTASARTHHHEAACRVASIIALILRKCSASATDEPPNLVILIMVRRNPSPARAANGQRDMTRRLPLYHELVGQLKGVTIVSK